MSLISKRSTLRVHIFSWPLNDPIMKYSIFTFLIGLAFGLSTFSQDRISDTFDTGAG